MSVSIMQKILIKLGFNVHQIVASYCFDKIDIIYFKDENPLIFDSNSKIWSKFDCPLNSGGKLVNAHMIVNGILSTHQKRKSHIWKMLPNKNWGHVTKIDHSQILTTIFNGCVIWCLKKIEWPGHCKFNIIDLSSCNEQQQNQNQIATLTIPNLEFFGQTISLFVSKENVLHIVCLNWMNLVVYHLGLQGWSKGISTSSQFYGTEPCIFAQHEVFIVNNNYNQWLYRNNAWVTQKLNKNWCNSMTKKSQLCDNGEEIILCNEFGWYFVTMIEKEEKFYDLVDERRCYRVVSIKQ